jgi:hypothetical protein
MKLFKVFSHKDVWSSKPPEKPVIQPKPVIHAAATPIIAEPKPVQVNLLNAKVKQNIQDLKEFVQSLPGEILPLNKNIDDLDSIKKNILKTRGDMAEYQRLTVMQNYLEASRQLIQSRFDENTLVTRMRQMNDFYKTIPASEKNDSSFFESWNRIFDLSAVTTTIIAKDHCPKCHKPLLKIPKQALLQCVSCALLTEHLMPLSSGSSWIKTSSSAQPENKRIKSVLAKLSQFKTGGCIIPEDVILKVRHYLKSKNHTSENMFLPTPVADALLELNLERYVPFAHKISNIINGVEVCELTDEQINEIMSRVRVVQMVFSLLQGRIERLHFFTSFFVHSICVLKGWHSVAAAFPPQRTKRILREQVSIWRTLLVYLKLVDSQHSWV